MWADDVGIFEEFKTWETIVALSSSVAYSYLLCPPPFASSPPPLPFPPFSPPLPQRAWKTLVQVTLPIFHNLALCALDTSGAKICNGSQNVQVPPEYHECYFHILRPLLTNNS